MTWTAVLALAAGTYRFEVVAINDLGPVETNAHLIRFDSVTGELNVLINEAEWNAREVEHIDLSANQQGCGRELFANFRSMTSSAETGAMSFGGEFA